MTKVLHIGAGNLYGGVETNLLNLARMRELCPELEPSFALNFEGRLSAALRESGAPVQLLGEMRASRPWTVWRARRNLSEFLNLESFHAVIFHSTWSFALLAPAARKSGTPLFLWLHAAMDASTWDQRRAMKYAPNGILVNSRHTAKSLSAIFPNVKIDIVHCAVAAPAIPDPEGTRAELRRQLGTPTDALVILQVSRIESLKGHRVLLEALARLERAAWNCWIAGGPQRPEEERQFETLKSDAARLNISDRVHFLGQRNDVPRLIAAADIVCQPNTGPESFGLVFIEALYAGKPVVTTAIGGALEILDESCGVLVPPNDAAALASALSALIVDGARRTALGRSGPARARELCDPERVLTELHAVLAKARESAGELVRC